MFTVRTVAARRPKHRDVHQPCPYGATNWADCDRLSTPMCSAMLDSRPDECSKRATGEHEGRWYCGVHYASRVNAALEAKRATFRKDALDERITAFLAWTADHPSVWSPREESNPVTILTTGGQPRVRGLGGGGGESNPASSEVASGRDKPGGLAGPTGQLTPKTRSVLWSAASGNKSPVHPK